MNTVNTMLKIGSLTNELIGIRKWFRSTDWTANKITTGEWKITDSRWIEYLEHRAHYRDRQDAINAELIKLKEG